MNIRRQCFQMTFLLGFENKIEFYQGLSSGIAKYETKNTDPTIYITSSNQADSFGVVLSSGLLSNENGGIRQSNEWPSSRSNRNVPL